MFKELNSIICIKHGASTHQKFACFSFLCVCVKIEFFLCECVSVFDFVYCIASWPTLKVNVLYFCVRRRFDSNSSSFFARILRFYFYGLVMYAFRFCGRSGQSFWSDSNVFLCVFILL